MKHLKYSTMLASTALLVINAAWAAETTVIDTLIASSDTPSSATQDYSYYCSALHNNYSTLYISGVSKEAWPWQRGFLENTVTPAWAKAAQDRYQYLYNPSCIEGPSADIPTRRQQQIDLAGSHGQQVVEIKWHY
jgi:hypothetical protein